MKQETLSNKIAHYIQKRLTARLEKFDKNAEKERNSIRTPALLTEFEATLATQRAEIFKNFEPVNWLTHAATRAQQITLVTHAIKFTHTDAKGGGIYASFGEASPSSSLSHSYLSTESIKVLNIDTVGNAAALDVAALLQLECDESSLIDRLAREDSSSLRPFATSEIQLEEWVTGFKKALIPDQITSHTLVKQLFFPISEEEYHLLSPVYASSLAQILYQKIKDSRSSEESKIARKAKKHAMYCSNMTISYPNTAVQTFGGTKPQNVSQLNIQRNGKSYLFNCAPPTWRATSRPPINSTSIFEYEYNQLAWRQAKLLQEYLLTIVDKDSTKLRRDQRASYLDNLIAILLNYAAEIINIPDHAGWSVESRLPKSQQLWLDPYRKDDTFQQERGKNDWQQEVADQFARWVNKKIKHEKLTMGDSEHHEWKKLLAQKLNLLKENL